MRRRGPRRLITNALQHTCNTASHTCRGTFVCHRCVSVPAPFCHNASRRGTGCWHPSRVPGKLLVAVSCYLPGKLVGAMHAQRSSHRHWRLSSLLTRQAPCHRRLPALPRRWQVGSAPRHDMRTLLRSHSTSNSVRKQCAWFWLYHAVRLLLTAPCTRQAGASWHARCRGCPPAGIGSTCTLACARVEPCSKVGFGRVTKLVTSKLFNKNWPALH